MKVAKKSTRETRLATLTKHIRPFNGESTKSCKEWLKDMNRSALQVDSSPEAMKSLALATLTGSTADFFVMALSTNANPSFTEIKL